ncbi:hypothetical protein KBB05_05385 [Patescibacteria group bacterium]|nr:hypothetical protein [Patescibacteria group bacterium]
MSEGRLKKIVFVEIKS